MKGPPPWASLVEASGVIGSCVSQLVDTASHVDVTTITSLQPGSFCIECHICGHSVEAKNKNLIKNGQWGTVFCSSCKASRKASKWRCTCGVPWHTCAEHRIQGMACKFVQHKHKALQRPAFLSKHRNIPLGVPGKMHSTVRRGSQSDPRNNCNLSQITGPKMVDQGVEPKMVRLSDCLDTQPSSSCKRLRWIQPDPMRQAERVNACKRTSHRRLRWKQPDPSRDGLIGKGALLNGSSRPEAGAGVSENETKERHILTDPTRKRVSPQRGIPSSFAPRRPARKRARSPTALDSLERIRSARINPSIPESASAESFKSTPTHSLASEPARVLHLECQWRSIAPGGSGLHPTSSA